MSTPDRFERMVRRNLASYNCPMGHSWYTGDDVVTFLRCEHVAVRALIQKRMREERRVDWAEDSFREVYLDACQDILDALDKRRNP